jgi:hypothetical protein
MRKTPRSSREIVAVAFFMFMPVFVLALMNAGQNQDQARLLATMPVPSNPGNDPLLSNGQVNASFGYANITSFKFTITYQSESNSSPTFTNVTLLRGNLTINYTMQKTNPLSSNYTAGVQFYKSTTIPATGNFSFYFTA